VKIHVVVFRIVTPRSDVVGYDPKAMVEWGTEEVKLRETSISSIVQHRHHYHDHEPHELGQFCPVPTADIVTVAGKSVS
jgi:hypothetical protein